MSTTAFPAATANAVCVNGIANGKFHGAITPTTPSGSCSELRALVLEVQLRDSATRSGASSFGALRASHVSASSAGKSSVVNASTRGLAVSATIMSAISSARSSTSSATPDEQRAPLGERRCAEPLLGEPRLRDELLDGLRADGRHRADELERRGAHDPQFA